MSDLQLPQFEQLRIDAFIYKSSLNKVGAISLNDIAECCKNSTFERAPLSSNAYIRCLPEKKGRSRKRNSY